AIFCLLMLEREFMAASANLFEPDPATAGLPILRDVRPGRFDCAMSTSLGFGGTNAALVFERLKS
ncbi:MAG: beta-ketoacyl-ACP synthase I, partial [Rhodocyclaceae bacterium]|nr:beta-ketoacyl-ACP synthase I [Rhodocyclaceae bacterium]